MTKNMHNKNDILHSDKQLRTDFWKETAEATRP